MTNRINGIVIDSTYAGDALAISVRLNNGSVLRVKRSLADGLGPAHVAPGTEVTIGWQPEACMLLPE
jgi:hypothetical protein